MDMSSIPVIVSGTCFPAVYYFTFINVPRSVLYSTFAWTSTFYLGVPKFQEEAE